MYHNSKNLFEISSTAHCYSTSVQGFRRLANQQVVDRKCVELRRTKGMKVILGWFEHRGGQVRWSFVGSKRLLEMINRNRISIVPPQSKGGLSLRKTSQRSE
jgi:hypothetical protein